MAIEAGNKGEWSELYTLGYLLARGGGFAADAKQAQIPGSFYKILEIFVDGLTPDGFRSYRIGTNTVEIFDGPTLIGLVERAEIKKLIKPLLKDLTSDFYSKTFPLVSGRELMLLLERDRIAASSNRKSHDLELTLLDRQTELPSPRVGFSVKSQIGSPSTLLNASQATNLTYVLDGAPSDERAARDDLIGKKGKALFRAMGELGYSLRLEGFDNKQFEKNLLKIDSQMPSYLSKVIKEFYLGSESQLLKIARGAFPPEHEASEQPVFKLKQLLGAIAMGMRPSQAWDGDITKFKGLILVKTDGEVLFYYLYNIAEFQDFLFDNVKLEQASTGRHNYGEVYEENDLMKIKLNLQIRFNR